MVTLSLRQPGFTPYFRIHDTVAPYSGSPRPHRGSRKMLMFGAQKSKPSWARLWPARSNCARLMRASIPMAMAMRWIASVSNVDARPTGSGNSVVPLEATPCSASLH